MTVGAGVGDLEGSSDGDLVGIAVGAGVGDLEGLFVGAGVGEDVGRGVKLRLDTLLGQLPEQMKLCAPLMLNSLLVIPSHILLPDLQRNRQSPVPHDIPKFPSQASLPSQITVISVAPFALTAAFP